MNNTEAHLGYSPEAENREKGFNIVHTIRVLRHPEKGSYAGELTDKGQQDAKNMGELYSRWERRFGDKVKLNEVVHSGHQRPKPAAGLIKDQFDATRDEGLIIREDERLAFKGSAAFDMAYEDAINKANDVDSTNYNDESAGVQLVVDTNNTPFDAESASSIEMSQNIGKALLDILVNTRNLESNKSYRSIVLSHSGVLENFMVDALKLRNEENNVLKMGGGLGFLEGFELIIDEKSPEDITMTIRFISPNYSEHYAPYSESDRARIRQLYQDVTLTKANLLELAGA